MWSGVAHPLGASHAATLLDQEEAALGAPWRASPRSAMVGSTSIAPAPQTMSDRILILMTTSTYKAHAFLEATARLGVSVTVGSDRPQVLSAAHPEENLTVSFLQPERGAKTILEFARLYPLRAVLATDDDGAILAAAAAEQLGLPHSPVEAVAAARNKLRTRERLAAAGLRTPRFVDVQVDADLRSIVDRVLFPCVVKPLFLSASRGVMRADDLSELEAALTRLAGILESAAGAAPEPNLARRALIETFIPGCEVALEGILTGGRLKVLAIFDKPDPLDGPYFEETIYVTPSRLQAGTQEAIAIETQHAVAALGLREGPIHAELRVNKQGPWILEIAPRSIGGLCARTLRFEEGVTLEELILRHALGRDVGAIEREPSAAGVMMIPIPTRGTLRGVAGLESAMAAPGVEDVRITIPIGQEVVPPPEGAKYLGFIFARATSPAGVEEALREAHRSLAFDIAPAAPVTPAEPRA